MNKMTSNHVLLLAAISLAWCIANVESFVPISSNYAVSTKQIRAQYVLESIATQLDAANVDISTPTPDEAAEMGARDWPQQFKKAGWSETVAEDKVVIRYILSGHGTVSSADANVPKQQIGPGTLVEITGPTNVDWNVNDGDEMIVLTPGYEEAGLLLGVAGAFVVLCGVLVATAGGN